MAARAMWKGVLKFGTAKVPVKLYSAVTDRTVRFRLLHEKDLEPVKQELVNPETGDIVEYEEIQRAFETEDGDFVLLEDEELEELEPEPSRDIEITRFVPLTAITHQWFDRPYYLGPDDSSGDYFALAAALKKQKKVGIGRWVMRNKEYVGALLLEGEYLMLNTLRHAGEVVSADALPAPGGRALDKREVQMAKQLVAALEDELDLTAFRDEYRDRVIELVEAKAAGKVIKFPRAKKKQTEKDLSDMLERSLKSVKKGA
jgi:DNA end-binding protein Ku